MIRKLVNSLGAAAILVASITSAAPLAAAPLLPPAAPRTGILPSPDSHYTNPQAGATNECANVERQFLLLNTEIVSGEPVEFRLLLKALEQGTGTEFIARLTIGTDIKFVIIPPVGQPYEYEGAGSGDTVPTAVLQMDEVEYFRYDFRLAMDRESISGAAFDMPGDYRIRVFLSCNKKNAEAVQMDMGTFTLNVAQPSGDDLKAFNILSTDYEVFEPIHTRALLDRRGEPSSTLKEKHRRLLQRVVDEAPSARLVPQALFVLALDSYFDGDIDKGNLLLDRVRSEYRDTPYYEEALFQQLKMAMTSGDEEATALAFRRIWQDPIASQLVYPNSNYWNFFVSATRTDSGTQWMIFEEPGEDPMDGRREQLDRLIEEHGGFPFGVPITIE